MSNPNAVRKTVECNVHAKKVYPAMNSAVAATAEYINIVIEAEEAERLASSITQAAKEAEEFTIRAARKPAVRSGKHAVSITYETRKAKRRSAA